MTPGNSADSGSPACSPRYASNGADGGTAADAPDAAFARRMRMRRCERSSLCVASASLQKPADRRGDQAEQRAISGIVDHAEEGSHLFLREIARRIGAVRKTRGHGGGNDDGLRRDQTVQSC